MTQYANGYKLEQAAKKDLEQAGYFVIRAGGSKGVADLVALTAYDTLLIQCKLDGYLLPAERAELTKVADYVGAEALIARWHKDGRLARRVKFVNTDSEEWRP